MAKVKTIRALSRGLEVMRALEGGAALTLHQLHVATALPKATLLRVLVTLEQDGFARRRIADDRYVRVASLNDSASSGPADALADVAAPILDQLCQRILWPSDLAVYRDGSMRIHETTRRQTPFIFNRRVFDYKIHVLQSAIGRAYLSACNDVDRGAVLTLLKASSDPLDRLSRDSAKVMGLIEDTNARGCGLRASNYTFSPGVSAKMNAMAVAVMARGRPVGAVNIIWIAAALTEEEFVAKHLPVLRHAASEIGALYSRRVPADKASTEG